MAELVLFKGEDSPPGQGCMKLGEADEITSNG